MVLSLKNNYIDSFINEATRNPNKQAVLFQEHALSYQELFQRANGLAQVLLSHPVHCQQIIPLILERNTDTIISILAVLMAGCAFLPISPLTPRSRIQFILDDTNASLVISNINLKSIINARITVLHPSATKLHSPTPRPKNSIAEHLAYVMYTSGSTGNPKGVLIQHQSMMNLFSSLITKLHFTEQDVVLALTDYTFDISLIELLMPLLQGATIVLTESGVVADGCKIKQYLARHPITLIQATPVTWDILLKEGWTNNGHTRLLVGGEQFKTNLAQRLDYTKQNVFNLYGPTETCMWSMLYSLTKTLTTPSVPLGYALDNTTIHILDPDMKPVAMNTPGELYIGGQGLALGYLNNNVLTQERFVIHPQTQARLYKTGDQVIAYDANTICYLGRADEQLKFGGIRIEAGEIESIIEQDPFVKKAVIKVHETDDYYKSLAAYIEVDEEAIFSNGIKANQDEIFNFLKNIYDETYLHAEEYEHGMMNNCGWQSSFTGQLFRIEELCESMQFIQACIQQSDLTHVLEVGCGTGSLLLEYIDKTKQCTIIEISSNAIDYVKKKLTPLQRKKVLFKNESVLDVHHHQQYSCIIINSVIQYLPSIHSLITTLTQLITATKSSGTIIIGDIRSLELMDLYLLAKIRAHNHTTTTSDFNLSAFYYKSRDTEIVLSPLFFHALKNNIPRISHVDISVKCGIYKNELNYFRYDVILHINKPVSLQSPLTIDYTNTLCPTTLATVMASNPTACICITNIPNPHIVPLIKDMQQDTPNHRIDPLLLPSMDAYVLNETRLTTIQSLLNIKSQTHEKLIEYEKNRPLTEVRLYLHPKHNPSITRCASSQVLQSYRAYCREPFNPWIQTVCFEHIKRHLSQHMIAWTMPSVYVWVEKWPVTLNGKLDKRKLELPNNASDGTPQSTTLEQLQTLWQHVTGGNTLTNQDFGSQGVSSLCMYFFLSTINQTFSITINYHDFREHPTLESLATYIETLLPMKPTSTVKPHQIPPNNLLFGSQQEENQPIVLLLTDSFHIFDINPWGAQTLFQSTPSKLIHHCFINLLSQQKIETTSLLAAFKRCKQSLFQSVTLEHKQLNKTYSVTIIGIHDSDRTTYAVTMTTMNESYQSLKSYVNDIINNLPGAVYWKDTEGRYMGCNKFVAEMAGFTSPEDMIGKTDYDLCWHEFAHEWRLLDKKVMQENATIVREEFAKLANGKVIIELTFKTPLKNERNEIIGIIGTSLDITERKEMEQALHQSQIAAEAANHAKTRFIANMSHDIRTPLTGVVGMSKLLEDSVADPRLKQYAHWLGDSGDQLLKMLNGILDVVSADNANEEDIHEETVDIRCIVRDILQLEQPSIKIKGIQLITKLDESIPTCIITDATKLHRILLNLLGNAIKFTEKGSVTLKIHRLASDKNTATIRFEVSDTGIGIPTHLQDKVFDRFFRITPSYQGIYAGHGVGLHIAQSYAQLLGSHIQLTSKPAIGTTFSFDVLFKIGQPLPVATAKQPLYLQQLTQPVTPKKRANINSPHLLLIEDNSIALLMLENLVTQIGARFTSATNGETALHLAKQHDFDLIITDLGLPVLSGIDLTAQLRAFELATNRASVPIIGLTAHAEKQIKQTCQRIGMNEIITKPITLDNLNTILSNYLTQKPSPDSSAATTEFSPATPTGGDLPLSTEALFELNAYALFNSNNAITTMSGNQQLFKTILLSVVNEHMPKDKAMLQSHHINGNWEAIEELAHYLKSGALYYGADRLVYACQYLERYRKAGHSTLLEPLYQQLIRLMDETCDAIKQWLA